MTASPALDPEDRLQEAVLSYLQSRDCGTPLDGHTLLDRYADISTQLQAFLDDECRLTPLLSPLKSQGPSDLAPPMSPRVFGRYELLEELGRGGMGIVYKARQPGVDRLVALKIVRAGSLASVADLERFRNETLTIAGLDHPHIVPIYDVGEHEGQLFYTMPLLEGGSLTHHATRYRDNPRVAAELVATIAGAVHHAHQRGVLHRDIKPSNILLDDAGRPYIADFGLAKRLDGDTSLTETGAVLGTPGYMSPEQALGRTREVTTASDIYGLGAVLYALLTGRAPFQGPTLLETLHNVRQRDPDSISVQNPRVDRDLSAIGLKCLEKDMQCRYASAAALADDLDRWLAGKPVQARTVGGLGRAWRWSRRNPLVAGLSTATIVLVAACLAGLTAGLITVTRAWQEADLHSSQAMSSAAALRQQLYAAQMPIAYQHWERGEIDELAKLLADYVPREEKEDLRGFEWHYLQGLARSQPRQRWSFSHQNIVYHAAFSPDGKHLATAGADSCVRLWDAVNGALKGVQDRLGGDGNCVAFFPEGQKLISACEDGTLREWDLRTLEWSLLPFQSQGEIHSLVISANGKWLVTAGKEPFVRVRSTSDWSIQTELKGHAALTFAAVLSPDARQLASAGHGGGPEGCVEVWNLEGANQLQCTIKDAKWIYTVAFSPDGKVLATGDAAGTVKLWDSETGRPLRDLGKHLNSARGVCFSPNGKLLASAGHDGRVRVWSLDDGCLRCHFKAHSGRIWSLSFSPNGQSLVTAGDDGATLWDLPMESWPSRSITVASGAGNRLGFAPNGEKLAVLTSTGRIAVGDVDGVAPFEPLPIQALVTRDSSGNMAFLSDGKSLGYQAVDGAIKIWRLDQNREELVPIKPTATPTGWDPALPLTLIDCAITSDGRYLAASYKGGLLQTWSLPEKTERFREQFSWPHSRMLTPFPDNRMLAVQTWPGSFRFLDLTGNRWLGEEHACPSGIGSMALAFDGKTMALGHADGSIRIVQVPSARMVARFSAHLGHIIALAFSPDGKTLASSSTDGTVRLSHVGTGLPCFTIADGQGLVRSLTFSSNGHTLAAGGDPDSHGHNLWLWSTVPSRLP